MRRRQTPLVKFTHPDGKVTYLRPAATEPRKRTIPSGTQRAVFARDGLRCRYCGYGHKDPAKFHIDHVIPWSKGGSDELDNLVVACAQCNHLKKAATWTPRHPKDRYLLEPYAVLRQQGMDAAAARAAIRTLRQSRARLKGMKKQRANREARNLKAETRLVEEFLNG